MRMRNLIWALHTTKVIGVAKDTKEAVRWWRMAADQGHANGRNIIWALHTTKAKGVAKDTKEAVRWVSKSG